MFAKEPIDERRPPLANLAKDPPDRLADEELSLVEHPGREPPEQVEVPGPARQNPQLREERGPPDPEAFVRRPRREPLQRRRMPLDEPADDVRRKPVDVRPGIGPPNEPDEPQEVSFAEQALVPSEERDRHRSEAVPARGVRRVDDR